MLNGIYIAAYILPNQAIYYLNWKSYISQNVLAVYDFNLKFIYVLIWWKESAHNYKILEDTIINGKLRVPFRKYLLTDVGYYNINFAFIPYCGVCY